jgi:hypothetical protein
MQSSQSSATVALRAIIMLAFVITIPLIAINGSSLPENAKKLLEKYWPAITSSIEKISSVIASKTPISEAKSQNFVSVPSPTLSGVGGISNEQARFDASAQPNILPVQAGLGNSGGFDRSASNVVPANYQSIVQPDANGKGSTTGESADSNQFLAMQNRLKQLGATYYLLETWGNQRQFYRFYCQMAVGGSASYTHYFEATNSNPMAAMAEVLRQVETWRGGSDTIR